MTTTDRTPTTRTPAEERLARIGWWLIATLAALNALDLLITHFVLAAGGVEGNPLMAAAYDHHPLAPVVLKLVCVAGIALWFRSITGQPPTRPATDPRGPGGFLVFSVALYILVVTWNTYAYFTLSPDAYLPKP